MNKKKFFKCLFLVVMVATSACDPTVAEAPAPEQPAAEESAAEEPAAPEATEAPATEEPEAPVGRQGPGKPIVPGARKPLLVFAGDVDVSNIALQSIAFTMPDFFTGATIAVKVAPFMDLYSYPYGTPNDYDGLTPVGLLEIGELGQPEPGVYLVLIDIQSGESFVFGRLLPLTSSAQYDLFFERIPQIINPFRTDSAYDEFRGLDFPDDNNATISAGSVCFVIKTESDTSFARFCSEPGSVLSVRDNFGTQYENLQASISTVAQNFGLQNDIQYDQIISEMENPGRIQACSQMAKAAQEARRQACGSDISAAPVTEEYFYSAYDSAQGRSSLLHARFPAASLLSSLALQDDGQFPVPVAVVQIHHQIETELGPVLPGDYRMDYWFDANGEFFAATISGSTTGGQEVTDQQVPAVPATFINEDGSEQSEAQISTCRIFGRCTFFQKSCS